MQVNQLSQTRSLAVYEGAEQWWVAHMLSMATILTCPVTCQEYDNNNRHALLVLVRLCYHYGDFLITYLKLLGHG